MIIRFTHNGREGSCLIEVLERTLAAGEQNVESSSSGQFGGNVATGIARLRLLATLAFLFAFALQSFVAQTHIHISGSRDSAFSASPSAGIVPSQDRAPNQTPLDDLSKCPVCQVAIAVGTAVGVAPFCLVQLPAEAIASSLNEVLLPIATAPAHVWNSRGPPLR